jgi:hypothetical protein
MFKTWILEKSESNKRAMEQPSYVKTWPIQMEPAYMYLQTKSCSKKNVISKDSRILFLLDNPYRDLTTRIMLQWRTYFTFHISQTEWQVINQFFFYISGCEHCSLNFHACDRIHTASMCPWSSGRSEMESKWEAIGKLVRSHQRRRHSSLMCLSFSLMPFCHTFATVEPESNTYVIWTCTHVMLPK